MVGNPSWRAWGSVAGVPGTYFTEDRESRGHTRNTGLVTSAKDHL